MENSSSETSALFKAAGILIGECVFGMYGPLFFRHPLRWFEMNFQGAIVIGVIFGAAVGYGVATCFLRVHSGVATANRQSHQIPVDAHLAANPRVTPISIL